MAIKTIELRKAIDENTKSLAKVRAKIDSFATRESALAEKIEKAEADEERASIEAEVESFNTEKAETSAEEERLKNTIAELEKELESIEANEPSMTKNPIERKIDKMENFEMRNSEQYINAYARYIKTGRDTEVRSLLSENASDGGVVPVPDMVGEIVRTAWDNNTIMSAVKKTYLKGNVKVGFEASSTGAEVHAEGAGEAIEEETLVLGIVTMTPENIKKWITVSDEALDLTGAEFLQYIYNELAYQIMKKASDELVAHIVSSPTASTTTRAGQPAITSAIAMGTIAKALGELTDEAEKPVIIMNKRTWADFKAVQYAGNFAVDVFEGLEVKFSSALPSYSTASANQVYAIVGDLSRGAQANLPNGDEITFVFDQYSLAERDLVKIVGREFIGMGVVAPKHFCNIKKPS